MIFLKSIRIENFKGISDLSCDFENLTILSGLNNSGKTSILQAVYLIINALRIINSRTSLVDSPDKYSRNFNHSNDMLKLGFNDPLWIRTNLDSNIEASIEAEFYNGLVFQIGTLAQHNFYFDVRYREGDSLATHPGSSGDPAEVTAFRERIEDLIQKVSNLAAEFLVPPSNVLSRENMLTENQYRNQIQDGRGAHLWRNSIWWEIQKYGFETFEPIRNLVTQYFPNIELLIPTLSTGSPSDILFKYKENSDETLDIAQAGAGLRTFLTLAQLLFQSKAQIVLIDEPDSHLHASQQEIVLELLMDTAFSEDRQVIIATHSPEILMNSPSEFRRWIEQGKEIAASGDDLEIMFEKLGVSYRDYPHLATGEFPEILVYVEGRTDKILFKRIIDKYRELESEDEQLGSIAIIPHREGRFGERELRAIAMFLKGMNIPSRIVGIRDLDWDYAEPPDGTLKESAGENFKLLTLPCKEMENLFCDPEFLGQVYGDKISEKDLREIVHEASKDPILIIEWKNNVLSRIRKKLPGSMADTTKEAKADETFQQWVKDDDLRWRLVSGKDLFKQIRKRLETDHGVRCISSRMVQESKSLPENLSKIVAEIFTAS